MPRRRGGQCEQEPLAAASGGVDDKIGAGGHAGQHAGLHVAKWIRRKPFPLSRHVREVGLIGDLPT